MAVKAALAALLLCLAAASGAAADRPDLLVAADSDLKTAPDDAAAAAVAWPLAGALVNGSLTRPDFPSYNFWDPTVNPDRVPQQGYGNSPPGSALNVPVLDTVVEFGYEDDVVLISADLTTVGTVTLSIYFKAATRGIVALDWAFQSPALSSYRVVDEVSSNLALPLNASLNGDTLLIRSRIQGPGFIGNIVQAVFKLTQCSKGTCCDKATGLFKPSTVICRKKETPCDATERCTGTSGKCPNDVGLPDGSQCLWYAQGDGYGYSAKTEDRSTLKMSVVQPAQVAGLMARKKQQHRKSKEDGAAHEGAREDEVCMGRCEAGTCFMDKQEAACCVPAAPGHEDGGAVMAAISSAPQRAYCWGGRDEQA